MSFLSVVAAMGPAVAIAVSNHTLLVSLTTAVLSPGLSLIPG